jgi:hypothetical protein
MPSLVLLALLIVSVRLCNWGAIISATNCVCSAHVCNVEWITGNLPFEIEEKWDRIVKNENLETERDKERIGEEEVSTIKIIYKCIKLTGE